MQKARRKAPEPRRGDPPDVPETWNSKPKSWALANQKPESEQQFGYIYLSIYIYIFFAYMASNNVCLEWWLSLTVPQQEPPRGPSLIGMNPFAGSEAPFRSFQRA